MTSRLGTAGSAGMAKGGPLNPRQWQLASLRRDQGFTLAELMVVVTLIAILSTISMTTYISYNKGSTHKGATRETVALLRNAQVRSVTEATTIECSFTSSEMQIRRSGTVIRTYQLPANLQYVFSGLSNGRRHGFTHPGEVAGSNGHSNCYFYAKGSATPGLIGVKRADTGRELYVEITGLTARVNYCAEPTPSDPCPV